MPLKIPTGSQGGVFFGNAPLLIFSTLWELPIDFQPFRAYDFDISLFIMFQYNL